MAAHSQHLRGHANHTFGGSAFWSLTSAKGLLEILDEVARFLQPHAHPDQSLIDARQLPLLWSQRAVGHARRVLDQVAFNLVQIELQAYESLMSTRTLLQGVIDFNPWV